MANSVNPDQIGAVCSGSTLFASIFDSSVMLGNFCNRRLQQMTFSDHFFLPLLGLRGNKSKKDSNDQESIQSSTTPVPGYQMGK